MKKVLLYCLLATLALAACQPNYTVVTEAEATEISALPTDVPVEEPTEAPVEAPTATPEPTEAPAPTEIAAPLDINLPVERGEFFATSGQCAICHVNMTDASGADVSLDSQWRASMMANSARDPYWQAGVRNEMESNPEYADFIQDKCATCHMPMARFTQYVHEQDAVIFEEDGMLKPDHELHYLAMDSVSCTLCHQIEPDGFGELEGFSGHYAIDAELPAGERHAYGPFAIADAQVAIMQGASGFVPSQSSHIQESELCGTCHTLYTPSLNLEGEIVGEFAEQMVYPEWLYSSYSETDSCLACHMPAADGGVVLSVTGGEPRSPFMQHIYVGGNLYMPQLLAKYGAELQITASQEQFDNTVAQVEDQLQNRTATVSFEDVQIADGQLSALIAIASQTGHKLPTSYPARRAWLHVMVQDADGNVVFESGAFNPDGSIEGNDGDADATLYEPHYDVISSPDEVQIYEAVMGNVEDMPTTTLLLGAGYLKDNRLLPAGFDKAAASPDIASYGNAADDENFIGGSDQIRYEIALGEASGPFSITAELRYQSIAYRWAQNLRQHDTFEAERFLRYYEDMPSPVVLIASASAEVNQ